MNTELLKPVQTCIINISEHAALIERLYDNSLVPPRKGIYKLGELKPVLHADQRYFTLINGNVTPITDFESTYTPIYSEDGDLVLSEFIMKNKRQFLSSAPAMPIIGSTVIKNLIEYHISTISPWSKSNGFHVKLHRLFRERIDEDHLIDICSSILQQIDIFIADDEWNVYFVDFIGIDIRIVKSIDYRIYEYTKWTSTKSVQAIQTFCDN